MQNEKPIEKENQVITSRYIHMIEFQSRDKKI